MPTPAWQAQACRWRNPWLDFRSKLVQSGEAARTTTNLRRSLDRSASACHGKKGAGDHQSIMARSSRSDHAPKPCTHRDTTHDSVTKAVKASSSRGRDHAKRSQEHGACLSSLSFKTSTADPAPGRVEFGGGLAARRRRRQLPGADPRPMRLRRRRRPPDVLVLGAEHRTTPAPSACHRNQRAHRRAGLDPPFRNDSPPHPHRSGFGGPDPAPGNAITHLTRVVPGPEGHGHVIGGIRPACGLWAHASTAGSWPVR